MQRDLPLSQLHVLRNDKWLLSVLTWIPFLLALAVWAVFSQGIARDIPFGVVDLDNSSLSRALIRDLNATSALTITDSYTSPAAAADSLVSGNVYGYAVIPRNYKRDISQKRSPQVAVFYNSQYVLIGRLINSAVYQVHATFNAKVGAAIQLAEKGGPLSAAFGSSSALRVQSTSLFNLNMNYAQFLVSAIIPALWQIIIIVSAIMVMAANLRIYGIKRVLGSHPLRSIVSIISFYLPFYIVMGMAFLLWFYQGFNWPFAGSISAVLYAQLLTVVACIIMGCFFFFLTLDPARAMSFAGAFTAPGFAFMGVTFPITDMNFPALLWRSLLPVSHYIEAQIEQVSYGVTQWSTISDISVSMAGYLLPLLAIYPLCKKHLAAFGEQK